MYHFLLVNLKLKGMVSRGCLNFSKFLQHFSYSQVYYVVLNIKTRCVLLMKTSHSSKTQNFLSYLNILVKEEYIYTSLCDRMKMLPF